MDGGAWWVTVHGVAKSRTQFSNFKKKKVWCNGLCKLGIPSFVLSCFVYLFVFPLIGKAV